MRNEDEFVRELNARNGLEKEDRLVVNIISCHVPNGFFNISKQWKDLVQPEPTEDTSTHPFLLIMGREGESLHSFLSSQRVAGYEVSRVAELSRSLANQILRLHRCGVVHFDIKPRNVLISKTDKGDIAVVLCDMDASAGIDSYRNREEKLGSGAYYAPEVLRLVSGFSDSLRTHASIDVWSFGVLLFAMCTGRHLFPQVITRVSFNICLTFSLRILQMTSSPSH